MTREEAIFKALSNANDTHLAEAENQAPLRMIRTAKRRWIPAAAAAALALSVGAVAAFSGIWDSLFLDRLHPNEAIMHKLEPMVQDIQANAVYDDLEITLTQTLGDAMSLYLALDVRFSEELNLAQYITSENPVLSLSMQGVGLYKDDGTQYAADLHRPFLIHGTYNSANYDPQTNSVRFLLTLTDENAELTRYDGIILVIDSIRGMIDDTGRELILEGPFRISWKAENTGPVYEFELMDGKEKLGDVHLSSLSLSVSILSRALDGEDSAEKIDTLYDSIRILMKDGSEFPLHPRNGSIGSMAHAVIWFDEVLDLEQVDTLFAAGYSLKLE